MINISLHIQKLPPGTGGGVGVGGTLIWTLVYSNLKSSFGEGGTLIWTLVNSNLKSSFLEGAGVLWSELWSTQIWSLHLGGGGVLWSELWSTQIWSLHWGGEGVLWFKLGQMKSEVFIGGGVLWSEIPERGALENLDKNLLFTQKSACASQIVSHILRMLRLISWKLLTKTITITNKIAFQ